MDEGSRPLHGVSLEATRATRYNFCSNTYGASRMRQKRYCGARTRRGTPCQCKAIETKRGAWRCKLHGGKSTGPTSVEGRVRIAAAARARHARARGNPLVPITVTADHTFLPLNAAGDVRHDWQSAGASTSKIPHGRALMAPADLAASLVDKGQARTGA